MLQGVGIVVMALLPLAAQAATSNRNKVETRQGAVEVVEAPGSTTLMLGGKQLARLDAAGASLYRVVPHDEREFVLVEGLKAAQHCRHFYLFIELVADGKALVSDSFGACKELKAVDFIGATPVVRLRDPFTGSAPLPQSSTDFIWRDGKMAQMVRGALKPPAEAGRPPERAPAATAKPAAPAPIPAHGTGAASASAAKGVGNEPHPLAAAAPAPRPPAAAADAAGDTRLTGACGAAQRAAAADARAVPEGARMRRVVGSGRLPLLSAPAASCAQGGLFVIPGDLVDAYRTQGDYTWVKYVNPKSGNGAQGWVLSARLGPAEGK